MEITISLREISNVQSKKKHLQVFSWWNPKFSIKNTLAFPAPNSTTPWDPSVTSVASLHSQSPALKAAEGNLAEMSLTFVEVKPCCGGSFLWSEQRHDGMGYDGMLVMCLKWHEVYLRDKYRLIEYGNGICTEYNGYDLCVCGGAFMCVSVCAKNLQYTVCIQYNNIYIYKVS